MHEAVRLQRKNLKMEEKMEGCCMSCYEQASLMEKQTRKINGGTAVGIAFGAAAIVGVALATMYGHARAKSAENLIASQQSSNQNFINYIANQQAVDHADRMAFQAEAFRRTCPQPVSLFKMESCCPSPNPCNGCGC